MADASDSKSDVGDNMWVQVPPPAPMSTPYFMRSNFFCSGAVRVRCGGILRKDGFVAFAASAAARLRADGRTQNPMLDQLVGSTSTTSTNGLLRTLCGVIFFLRSGVVRV